MFKVSIGIKLLHPLDLFRIRSYCRILSSVFALKNAVHKEKENGARIKDGPRMVTSELLLSAGAIQTYG